MTSADTSEPTTAPTLAAATGHELPEQDEDQYFELAIKQWRLELPPSGPSRGPSSAYGDWHPDDEAGRARTCGGACGRGSHIYLVLGNRGRAPAPKLNPAGILA